MLLIWTDTNLVTPNVELGQGEHEWVVVAACCDQRSFKVQSTAFLRKMSTTSSAEFVHPDHLPALLQYLLLHAQCRSSQSVSKQLATGEHGTASIPVRLLDSMEWEQDSHSLVSEYPSIIQSYCEPSVTCRSGGGRAILFKSWITFYCGIRNDR